MVGYQFDRYLNPAHILLLVFHYLLQLDLDNGPLFSIPVHIKMKSEQRIPSLLLL